MSFFHDLPAYLSAYWNWATAQNGAYAFLLGAFGWFVVERVFGFLTSPVSKLLSLLGIIFVICFALAMMIDFSGSFERGSIPFERSTKTPGVETLREVE